MTLQLQHDVIREMVLNGRKIVEASYRGKTVWRETPGGRAAWLEVAESTTIPFPAYAEMVDIVCLGGGGGGGGGSGAAPVSGEGGGAGGWKTTSWYSRAHEGLVVTIGQGGAGGAKEKNGTAGGATTVIPSTRDLKCEGPGGAGGVGATGTSGSGAVGKSPGVQTFWDTPFAGGGEAGVDTDGLSPGGGGGPGAGGIFGGGKSGRRGGNGRVWIRFRSY